MKRVSGTVHPRERGEQPPFNRDKFPGFGSSPRARGTGRGSVWGNARRRFIPASAGNSPAARPDKGMGAVHPRERGEQFRTVPLVYQVHGSSPRARGTVVVHHDCLGECRFIPASAGNSVLQKIFKRVPPVHPRERGEQWLWLRRLDYQTGSSPRARGTAEPQAPRHSRSRFIPASAGNRSWFSEPFLGSTVHPRERGEQSFRARNRISCGGSSPRARGTVGGDVFPLADLRFIPASAGNSQAKNWRPSPCAVHPRERGEQVPLTTNGHYLSGSSPRARGTD